MEESWLYWVTVLVQKDGKAGLTGQMVEAPNALNDTEAVADLIETLSREYFTDEELDAIVEQREAGDLPMMPVIPINWVLVRAQRGANLRGNGRAT